MPKTLSKILLSSVALLFVASTGISSSNVHASHHSQHYVVDVFPNKSTHNNFAYQLSKSYHTHIYEANLHSHIGHNIFGYYGHKKPSTRYEHYLKKHHAYKWHELKNELKANKNITQKKKDKKSNVIVLNKTYNQKQVKLLIKQLHKHYHHLIYKKDIIKSQNHKIQHGLLIGLHNNQSTKKLMNKVHQYNYAKLSNEYKKSHPTVIKWYKHNVVHSQSTKGDSVLEHYRQHHHDNKVIEMLGLTANQIASN